MGRPQSLGSPLTIQPDPAIFQRRDGLHNNVVGKTCPQFPVMLRDCPSINPHAPIFLLPSALPLVTAFYQLWALRETPLRPGDVLGSYQQGFLSPSSWDNKIFLSFLFYTGVEFMNEVVLVSGVQLSDSVTRIHLSILLHILFLFRLLHNIEPSPLCYTVGTCWLSMLNTAVCECPSQTPSSKLSWAPAMGQTVLVPRACWLYDQGWSTFLLESWFYLL